MHNSKINFIFLQRKIQPSFGGDHFCVGKQYPLLLSKDFAEKKGLSGFTIPFVSEPHLFLNLLYCRSKFLKPLPVDSSYLFRIGNGIMD